MTATKKRIKSKKKVKPFYKITTVPFIDKSDERYASNLKQLRETGVCDVETWNLDFLFASFITPRLIRFRKIGCCCPGNLTQEEWNKKLDQMIKGFKLLQKDPTLLENSKKISKAFKLFGKYGRDLWL